MVRSSLAFVLVVTSLAACGGKSTGAHAAAPADLAVVIEPLERTVPATEDEGEIQLRAPRVTSASNPAVAAAINTALGTPADAAALDPAGEVGLDFVVDHNGQGLLSLALVHETMGAYPDSYVDYFLFDLTTGARLTVDQLFRADALAPLAAALDAKLQPVIAAARAQEGDCADLGDGILDRQFTVAELKDVVITKGAVGFVYPFDFPHVMQACEPDGLVSMSVAELAPFLSASSPLHRLAR
jgi:hypothetical protein